MIVTFLLTVLRRLQSNNSSPLENFISRHNPTSAAEVEHWTREFDRQQQRRML